MNVLNERQKTASAYMTGHAIWMNRGIDPNRLTDQMTLKRFIIQIPLLAFQHDMVYAASVMVHLVPTASVKPREAARGTALRVEGTSADARRT